MMNRAKVHNANQQRNDQANMLQTLKNLQVSALRTDFPQMVILKQTEATTEYRVPLQLSVSPQPLYIKVTLGQTFPATKPTIAVMSRVSHQNIEPNTYSYKGPCLM